MVIRASLGLVLCLGLIAPAFAQSVEQFYRGREVRLLIGEPPGGGYDLYGRFLARHLSRFLPGNPSILPENMPGAASVTMTNALFFQMPKDGSVIGSGAGSVGTAALFGSPGARYDARRLGWIGSLNSEVGMVVAWHLANVKSAADLFVKPLIVGGSGATDGNVIFPNTIAQQQMGRPVFAPPDIPAERLAALRQGFEAMMRDPQVLADAESHHIEINQPMPGAEIERLIQHLHGFPPSLVAQAAQAIRPAARP
jgi:tripartite-type tricarboxylate transporter receptor subunit TctC